MNVAYLAKRVLIAVLSLWVVATAVFAMTHLLPGSAANIILGTTATDESVQQVRQQLGLNRPLWVQYVDFVGGVFVADFGTSFVSDQPVIDMVVPRLNRTLQLALVATLISVVTAIPLGVVAASRRNGWVDSVISTTSYVGVSIPSFVSATLLLLFLTTPPLSLFPTGGYVAPTEDIVGWAYHIILPAISLNVIIFAYVMRQTRSSMIETLESDYIRTARLKGVGEYNVLFKHALRNGLLPAITVVAINFGWMMGSVVIVETIFNYPGMGKLIIRGITNRDLPLIQAGILVPTAAFITANLLADIVYTYLDPRISLGEG